MKNLKPGTEVTINIPFTYTIGEEGPVTGNVLETVEDCEAEVMTELDQGDINGSNVMLEVEDNESLLFKYANDHGLLSCKSDIEEFNDWVSENL